jgi:hypothetical protein
MIESALAPPKTRPRTNEIQYTLFSMQKPAKKRRKNEYVRGEKEGAEIEITLKSERWKIQ